MAPIANGSRARPARSNSHDQPTHLAPSRVNALNSKNTPVIGTSSADSLLDLYRDSNKSGPTSLHDGERSAVGNKCSSAAMLDEDDPGWIHRDKLARIESRELQAAGIILPRNRAYSKTGRSNRSRETSATGLGQRTERSQQRRPQIESRQASRQEVDQEDQQLVNEGVDDKTAWDLRTPEEIEEDSLNATYYHERSQLSKGASKIPLAMQSRIPVPLDFIERPIPAQRTKSAVWGSDGECGSIEYPKPKEKEHVRAALEEPVASQPPTAEVKLSPPKNARDYGGAGHGKRNTQSATHSPIKSTSGTAVRKSNTMKTPPVSNTRDFNGRPKTRSGSQSQSRPVTRGTGEVRRPEGDPPWLATMFKPDPRLPPDQQLLPTVAKRLAQENWEKEGKFGNAYDTNFRPLNDEELRRQELPPSPTKPQLDVEIPKERGLSGEWPLKSPDREGRPATAGGYSTMPKISTQPPMNQAPVILPNPPRVEQMQEEQPKTKGGCGCCIVM